MLKKNDKSESLGSMALIEKSSVSPTNEERLGVCGEKLRMMGARRMRSGDCTSQDARNTNGRPTRRTAIRETRLFMRRMPGNLEKPEKLVVVWGYGDNIAMGMA
jgi:hypothetical protein